MITAPVAASLGTVAFVAAVALREAPLLAPLVGASGPGPSPVLERIGAMHAVRRAVSASRLAALVDRAEWAISPVRLAGSAAAFAVAAGAACLLIGGPAVALAPVAVLVSLRTPVFAAARAAARRVRAVDRDVPLLLDVLSLASFAGLPPQAALGRAVRVLDGPLAAELSRALSEVDLGARWRDRLRRLAIDVPVPDLRRAIGLLVRTESIGSGAADQVSALADEVRASRRAAASERARKAPVHMLFPLVFLVLPAFLLLTVVPVLVATLGSIG